MLKALPSFYKEGETMFKAFLYKCKDDRRKINKTLEDEVEIPVDFNRRMNFSNGELILQGSILTFSEYNYVYLPYFKRYFFVTNIEASRNNLIKMSISTDVLMTYKDSIVQIEATSKRSTDYEPYMDGVEYPVEVRETYRKYTFESPFKKSGEFILVSIGNV